jgi:hypothetical protein
LRIATTTIVFHRVPERNIRVSVAERSANQRGRDADHTAAWDAEQPDANGRLTAVRRASTSADMLVAPRKQSRFRRWRQSRNSPFARRAIVFARGWVVRRRGRSRTP